MTLQELKDFPVITHYDLEKEKEKLEKEINDINGRIGCSSNIDSEQRDTKTQLEEKLHILQQYMGKYHSPAWQMSKIKNNLATFHVDKLTPIFAELFTALEGKKYKYYEVLSTDREWDDDYISSKLCRNFYRVFSTIPYAVYYPENHFAKRKEEDKTLICLDTYNGPTCLGQEEFGKHIYFERSKYLDVAVYQYFENRSSYLISPSLCNEDFTSDSDANDRIMEYSRQFIDKVIDYRIGKMYANYTLPALPVYNEFLLASEDEDITTDELKVLLDEFVTDYKTKGIQKKK